MNRAIRRAAKFKRGLQTQIHRHVDPTAGLRVLHNARPYEEGEPFVENTRAVLIHRPRFVSEHKISDKYPFHLAVSCWCGTSFTGRKQFTFLDRVPDGKLLCERCEVAAFAANQPKAESIVGGHVHLGRLVAQQTCCIGRNFK